MEQIVFFTVALLTIVAALFVISARNAVNSVLSLIVTFFGVAGLYIMLDAPFLAVVQLIVYAGAVMVLFLFVIMLLDLREGRKKLLPVSWFRLVGAGLAGLFSFLMAYTVQDLGHGFVPATHMGTIENIATLLFGKYFYLFELSSILLMAALVGAVVLSQKPEDPA